jgi:hypothetical protein
MKFKKITISFKLKKVLINSIKKKPTLTFPFAVTNLKYFNCFTAIIEIYKIKLGRSSMLRYIREFVLVTYFGSKCQFTSKWPKWPKRTLKIRFFFKISKIKQKIRADLRLKSFFLREKSSYPKVFILNPGRNFKIK